MINKVKADDRIVILLLIFSFIFVFFGSKSSPLYLFNDWGDPNVYFSMGKGLANGKVIYKDIFDHKGPVIFVIYSIAYLISKDTFGGVYILESVALFVNLLFAYRIAHLFINKQMAFVAAIIYAVLIFNKSYVGGSAEEFIFPAITISFYYFIYYFRNDDITTRKGKKYMLIHGALFTLAFLSKLSICVFWVPLILAIYYVKLTKKQYSILFSYTIYFIGGVLLAALPFFIYFWANNALKDFYWGYIEFNSIYAELKLDFSTLRLIASRFVKRGILTDYYAFSILLLGVFTLSFTKKYCINTAYRVGILISFALSYAMVAITPYLMTYAQIVIYVYAIFGVIFVLELIEKYIIKKPYTIVYIVAPLIALYVNIKNKNFFDEDKECLLRKKECTYMQKEFAAIIQEEDNPTLLNLGLDMGVFTKANVVPSYKYFFNPNISYNLVPEVRDYQARLIRDKEPMFITTNESSTVYHYFKNYPSLRMNYELVAVYPNDSNTSESKSFLYKRKKNTPK